MKSPKPVSIGRIVIYVPAAGESESHNGAQKVPAVVVRTWEETSYEDDEINLKVLCDGPHDTWRTSVPYNEDKLPGSWHWPEMK
jgi:hypothetical protein